MFLVGVYFCLVGVSGWCVFLHAVGVSGCCVILAGGCFWLLCIIVWCRCFWLVGASTFLVLAVGCFLLVFFFASVCIFRWFSRLPESPAILFLACAYFWFLVRVFITGNSLFLAGECFCKGVCFLQVWVLFNI